MSFLILNNRAELGVNSPLIKPILSQHIDRSNSLSEDLEALWLFDGSDEIPDLVGKHPGAGLQRANGSFGATAHAPGEASSGTRSSESSYITASVINHNIGQGDFSVLIHGRKTTTTTTSFTSAFSNGSFSPAIYWDGTGGANFSYWNSGERSSEIDLEIDRDYVIIVQRRAGQINFFFDGEKTTATAADTNSIADANWYINYDNSGYGNADYYSVAVFSRSFSDAEAQQLSRNPYQLIRSSIPSPLFFSEAELIVGTLNSQLQSYTAVGEGVVGALSLTGTVNLQLLDAFSFSAGRIPTMGEVSSGVSNFVLDSIGEIVRNEASLNLVLDNFTAASRGNIQFGGTIIDIMDNFQSISSARVNSSIPNLGTGIYISAGPSERYFNRTTQ